MVIAQIPLRRLPQFPGSRRNCLIELGLKGTSRVCRGHHGEIGIVEFGLKDRPAKRSSLAHRVRPWMAAFINAVNPSLLHWSTLRRWNRRRRKFTISSWPAHTRTNTRDSEFWHHDTVQFCKRSTTDDFTAVTFSVKSCDFPRISSNSASIVNFF